MAWCSWRRSTTGKSIDLYLQVVYPYVDTMTAAAQGTASEDRRREARARNDHVALVGVFGDDFAFKFGESDDAHVVHTSGTEAVDCTCPDRQHRGVKCKHMIAYEHWSYIDEFDF